MEFLDYFSHTYIVNLPEREDRRTGMNRELKRAGFACSGPHFRYFPAIKPTEKKAFPSNGVLGCFLSHLEILKLAERENLQNVVIMEDDLAIPNDFAAAVRPVCQQLATTPWDVVLLGHLPYQHSNIAESEPAAASEYEPCSLQPTQVPLRGTHFYAVNQCAYRKLIYFLETLLAKRIEKQWLESDGLIDNLDGAYLDTALYLFNRNVPNVNFYAVSPSLGWQRNSSSDISPGRFDQIAWLKTLMNDARSLRYGLARRLADR
ncbi:MAG: glycosyltransferase family 25 protein [Cyanobacteria bacterium P01_C01_bin.120]